VWAYIGGVAGSERFNQTEGSQVDKLRIAEPTAEFMAKLSPEQRAMLEASQARLAKALADCVASVRVKVGV
jgi:hypothetical protein